MALKKIIHQTGNGSPWVYILAFGALLLTILVVLLLQQSRLMETLHHTPMITAKPENVADQLTATPSFQSAVGDFVSVVGVTERDIQVRVLDTAACTLCEMKENITGNPTRLSVEEADALVQSGYSFWLYVGAFQCAYYFAADGVRPLSCTDESQ